MKHPITIHEQSNACIFKAPFNFRNFLAEILADEYYTLDIRCSQEMLDNEEFEVEIEFETLGITIVEILCSKDSKTFECTIGDDFHEIRDAASFWHWVATCGRKNLTNSQS